MRRVVERLLPHGDRRVVHPFHISLEGLEKLVLCRDDEDYDAFVKFICICAWRKNVILIIYAVVSNHCHAAVLAACQQDADGYASELKKMCSMWFSRKYGRRGVLQKTDAKAIWIDSDWYLRNTLAYIPRNALDNGCDIRTYMWSGYSAMFSKTFLSHDIRAVAYLTKREKRLLMHTDDDLSQVLWMIDSSGYLIPSTICDSSYLEQAFENSQAFFLKTLGGLNSEEMNNKLIVSPRTMKPDSEFYREANDICHRWYNMGLDELPVQKKVRLVTYLFRTNKTTVNQLARVLSLDRMIVGRAIHPGSASAGSGF